MSKRKKYLNTPNYISILFSIAKTFGFQISSYSEELLDKPNNLISTVITGFNLENDTVRFVAPVSKDSVLNTPQLAAKALLLKLYKEMNVEYNKTTFLPLTPKDKISQDKNTFPLPHQAGLQSSEDTTEKQNTYTTASPELVTVPRAEHFLVSNDRNFIRNSLCPFCNIRMRYGRFNIPVYSVDGNIRAYYICTLWVCYRCHNQIMTENEWNNLLMRITHEKDEVRIRPTNMRYVGGKRSTRYLYEPIAGTRIFNTYSNKKGTTKTNTVYDSDFSGMSKTSFLKDAGYSTALNRDARRRILDEQICIHGQRRIADYLRKFISLHEKRGSYSNAVSIWQEDLNYIANSATVKLRR